MSSKNVSCNRKFYKQLFQDRCLKIGEAHLGACGGSASQVWDDLGDCLTDAIAKTEAVRGKREALKAWITLISFLVGTKKI